MPRCLNNLNVKPDYNTIFSRLGYKKSSTMLDKDLKRKIISWIDEADDLICLSAMTEILKLTDKSLPGFPAYGKSSIVSRLLAGCSRVLVIGITAGVEIMDKIDNLQKEDMTKAVVFDAAAGEITDSGLDFIISLYSRELLRESKKVLSKRISPGYGDFSIEYQADIYRLLKLDRIGLKLNSSFMLIPQKSVTAVTGIKNFTD